MDKYYVIVAGNGQTSRANVEALIEDYVYAHGNDVVFILAYEDKPAPAQAFVSQWAKDKSKDVIVFAKEGAKFDGISSASVNQSDTPYEAAVKFLPAKSKAVGFILWDDIDPNSNKIALTLSDNEVECFDLTDGLVNITLKAKPEVETEEAEIKIPEAEKISPKPKDEPEEEEDDFEWDDEEDDEDAFMDEVYFGLQALVKAIAREVVKELKAEEKPAKGAKE